jgi:large subunit ribosomal protein L33
MSEIKAYCMYLRGILSKATKIICFFIDIFGKGFGKKNNSSTFAIRFEQRRNQFTIMAKKGNRIQVILECTEHKESGLPGMSRYITTKNRKNTTARIELKKYNPVLKKVTLHKEIK